LSAQGAGGGPLRLSQEPFFIGINDPVGMNPAGTVFTSNAFTLFDGWSRLKSADRDPFTELRLAIARGQQIFNTHTFTIEGVNGLNGETFPSGVRVPESLPGTCTVCHDSPNVGNHSVKAPLDIGLTSASRRTSDLPLYTLINLATGQMIETTDPGRAMITGKWKDIGKFKGPILRALAARAVLPQWIGGNAGRCRGVLQRAVPDGTHAAGTRRPGRVPARALRKQAGPRPQARPFQRPEARGLYRSELQSRRQLHHA
jgi:hypothetical protein